jgi:hypothetical protein
MVTDMLTTMLPPGSIVLIPSMMGQQPVWGARTITGKGDTSVTPQFSTPALALAALEQSVLRKASAG